MHDADDTTVDATADPMAEQRRFHAKVRRALAALEELAAGRVPRSAQAREAHFLRAFFAGPLVWHDLDEETVLLPRLVRALGEGGTRAALARMRARHLEAERETAALGSALDRVVAGDDPPAALAGRTGDVRARVEAALAADDELWNEIARTALDDDALASLAAALAARRRARPTRATFAPHEDGVSVRFAPVEKETP